MMNRIYTICMVAYFVTISLFGTVPAQDKAKEESKPSLSFGGYLEYRFRYDYIKQNDADGKEIGTTGDYSNLYAWYFSAKATINENLLFGMRLSNPSGGGPDKISDNLSEMIYKSNSSYNYRILSIPEMYFKWSVSAVSLSFGIIPVPDNTLLNLVYTEPHNYLTKGLCEAGYTTWKVWMNNSQTGLELGLSLVKDKTTFVGLNVLSAVATDAGSDSPSYALKNDQLRFLFSAPISILEKRVSFLPMLHMRTNVYRSSDKKEANHSFTGGIDIGINPSSLIGFNLGYAIGGFNNDAVAPKDSVMAPLGMLANATVTLQPGYGKAIVFFNYGMTTDREADPAVKNSLIHFDLKYAMPIKSLTIMPRLRIWNFINGDTDASELRLRPEFFVSAKF